MTFTDLKKLMFTRWLWAPILVMSLVLIVLVWLAHHAPLEYGEIPLWTR